MKASDPRYAYVTDWLSKSYENGEEVELKLEKEAELYQKAVDLGCPRAKDDLKQLYREYPQIQQ